MSTVLENPRFTIQSLDALEDRIKSNRASADEYRTIDSYLSFLGVDDYLPKKMRESSFSSYDEFIRCRQNVMTVSKANAFLGILLGVISVLRKQVSGKL